MSQTLHYIEP